MANDKTITREFLRRHYACYSDERLAELVPPEGLTTLEVLRRTDVPAEDRLWVATREGAVPTGVLQRWAIVVARRALDRIASPDPRSFAVLDAAEAYLDGRCDRAALDAAARAALDAAARAAADAAWAAADAAWAAADAAWDGAARAADAAADAAWAAADAAADAAARAAADAAADAAAARVAERDAQVAELITFLEKQPDQRQDDFGDDIDDNEE